MKNLRPDSWAHQRSRYFELNQPQKPHHKTRQSDYEAGADALLEALYQRLVGGAVWLGRWVINYETIKGSTNWHIHYRF